MDDEGIGAFKFSDRSVPLKECADWWIIPGWRRDFVSVGHFFKECSGWWIIPLDDEGLLCLKFYGWSVFFGGMF